MPARSALLGLMLVAAATGFGQTYPRAGTSSPAPAQPAAKAPAPQGRAAEKATPGVAKKKEEEPKIEAVPVAKPTRPSSTSTKTLSKPTAPSGRTHTVARGDTLFSIAQRYGTTAAAIAAASGIDEDGVLQIGQVVTIPGS